MQRAKRVICLLICFTLLWNSTSYLAEAQDVDKNETLVENNELSEEQQNEEVIESQDKLENQQNNEEISLLTEEQQSDDDNGLMKEEEPKDIFSDKDMIINLQTTVDKVNKSITLQWEKVAEYNGIEAVIYKNIDRSDDNPLVVDITEDVKDVVEDTVDTVEEDTAAENQTEEIPAADLEKVILDGEIIGEAFEEGVVYYIDIRAYSDKEVVWEDTTNEDDVQEDSEVSLVTEEITDDVTKTVKEYGKCLSTVVVFLEKPVASVKAGDTECTINWNIVSGATKYEVIDVSTGKVVKTVDGNSVKVTGLKNSVSYKYQVRAVAELKAVENAENIYTYTSDLSDQAGGTTKIVTPTKVSGLSLTPYNLGAILKWNKVSGATQYEIYRYDTKTKKWKSIKKTTDTTYKNTGLTNNRKYTYKVRAIRSAGGKTATGAFSAEAKITAKKYLTCSVHPIYYKARVKSKTSLYIAPTGKAKAGYLKAGTKVTVLKRANGGHGRCYVKIKGKYYWLARKKLSFYGGAYTSKDFTTAVKEEFVNKSGYSSKTKYLLWISSYTQKVNLFEGSKGKWKLKKTYKCATGKYSTATLQGTYKINKKKKSSGGRTYWKYLSCFYGGTSFHTLLYRGGRIVDSRLGRPVSNSCVRMKPSEAKWIYDKIPKGTAVVSY